VSFSQSRLPDKSLNTLTLQTFMPIHLYWPTHPY